MTIARGHAWPRRRTPWLRSRFGRGLLWPGALSVRLRRTGTAYTIVERWRDRSVLTVRTEPRYAVALWVSLGAAARRPASRGGGTTNIGRVGPPALSRPVLAPGRGASPVAVASALRSSPSRLESLTTGRAGQARLVAREPSAVATSGRVLTTAAPLRVLARAPRTATAVSPGRETGALPREPVAQRGSSTEAGLRPPDIERLTESVMAAIERRLWSHRERMGRV